METPYLKCAVMLHSSQRATKKDLLTDPTGSRRFICIEVTGTIDTNKAIDYEQLYAQACTRFIMANATGLTVRMSRL